MLARTSLLDDVATRSSALRDNGSATIFECTEHELADRLADAAGKKLNTLRVGTHHIVVPTRHVKAFRPLVRGAGYGITADEDRRDVIGSIG